MKHTSSLLVCLALSCSTAAVAGAGGMRPLAETLRTVGANVRARIPAHVHRRFSVRGRHDDPSDCSANYSDNQEYFLGIPVAAGANLAGGQFSAAVGGESNHACADHASVLAGDGNIATTTASYSAIAGGLDNDTDQEYTFIGGGVGNYISGNAVFATIGGGGDNVVTGMYGSVGAGATNYVSGDGSAIAGGGAAHVDNCSCSTPANQVTGSDSFLGAGDDNAVTAANAFLGSGNFNGVSGSDAFVGSGYANVASGNGAAVVGGGYANFAACGCSTRQNQATGTDAFIGAGDLNFNAGNEAFIGAGAANAITQSGMYGSLIGGRGNTVSAQYATVIGGYLNTASGTYAIVAGGNSDTAAGTLTYAAGYHADAIHNGSFIWSDYSAASALLKDTAANQFLARSSGGFFLYSNEAATAGVKLAPGSGTWASLSDRNAKSGIARVDDDAILSKLGALPVDSWSYTSEKGVRHIGPMAQDFYAAFQVGEDDRHITSIDEDGVALAAIQALHTQLLAKNGEIATLRSDVGRLERSVESLERNARSSRR